VRETAGCVSSTEGKAPGRPAEGVRGETPAAEALRMRCSDGDGGRCAMSAVPLILPMIWATEEWWPEFEASRPVADRAYYRRYTEALLRRYQRMSMEAGRAPSLLGRELFRGRVTGYQVHSFDDVVIFVHDVEKCLARLLPEQRHLIERIALQEYTQDETVELTGVERRTMLRRYRDALDRLTSILLEKGLLIEAQEPCLEALSAEGFDSYCVN
jgi:Sigma-70, region 4